MTMDARPATQVRSSSSSSWSTQHQKRQGLLKDQLRLVKRRGGSYEIERVPDALSFEKGIFLFMRACQLLSQSIPGVILVGLAGPSGAGKTVFSEKVSKFKPGITVISMDNYNDGSRVVDDNYDGTRIPLLLLNIRNRSHMGCIQIYILLSFKLNEQNSLHGLC